ncbi:MAG: hypothetical protein RBG13Loki_3562 [Promethearchaeota archaeon CR_4]|nr:MAG: hypothetical protein RBG13Loki_3562 [Candidatus Lokiarchaeota archaeon CR_4]
MDEKIFSVTINGKECGFILEPRDRNTTYSIIPDCGGMADSEPRVPDQIT